MMALSKIETDWKLNPNVDCQVKLVKLKNSESVQFHRTLEEDENTQSHRQCHNHNQSVETSDTQLNFKLLTFHRNPEEGKGNAHSHNRQHLETSCTDTDTDWQSLLLALSVLSNNLHKCVEKCGTCDEYIQKLQDHIIQTHRDGSIHADSRSSTVDNFTFRIPKIENYSSVNESPSDGMDDYSTNAFNSVTNPPLNHFSLIEQNLKEEEEQIVYEDDPLLDLESFSNMNCVNNFPENITSSVHADGSQSIEMSTNNQKNLVILKTRTLQKDGEMSGFKCSLCGMHLRDLDHVTTHYKSMHPFKKTFKCGTCKLTFNSSSKLSNHQRIHNGYKCDSCEQTFRCKGSLSRHKKLHTKEKRHKCELCGQSFKYTHHFIKHKLIHTQENQFKCDICQKSFPYRSNLTTHKKTHTGQTPYTCDECGKSFATKYNLKTHKFLHTGMKPYECELCGKSFKSKYQLTSHKLVHTQEKQFKCDICEKSFRSPYYFNYHKRAHTRTGDTPHSCDQCGKSFATISHFNRHKITHKQEKQFKCDICEKSFGYRSSLKNHKRVHTGDTHSCDECGKSFATLSNFNRHKFIHTGVKPYECDFCGKKFSLSQHLTKHTLIHTGEKSFKCGTCGKCFLSVFQLNRHKLIHGRENVLNNEKGVNESFQNNNNKSLEEVDASQPFMNQAELAELPILENIKIEFYGSDNEEFADPLLN